MYVLDTSSIVHLWDDYPKEVFPKLWDWLSELGEKGRLYLAEVSLTELKHVSPGCLKWVKENQIPTFKTSNAILKRALSITPQIDVENDNYHSEGVDENDLYIVATAQEHGCSLISNESPQNQLPKDKRRYKIPAVCDLPAVSVECENALWLIKQSGRQFG